MKRAKLTDKQLTKIANELKNNPTFLAFWLFNLEFLTFLRLKAQARIYQRRKGINNIKTISDIEDNRHDLKD